jgi:cytosine/uracil/thiamine/allantoin permease
VKFSQAFRGKKARKWMWIGLAAFVALQIYFVQEMLAALLLFTCAFIMIAILALVIYLVDSAGQWSLVWAGKHSRPAIHFARRGLVAVEEISKKQLHRPRSAPVR